MMKFLVYISRVLVGSLFIVSGLIKANDALGFSYKLEEYFSPKALTLLEFMQPIALPLAIFICVVEVVLGIALLLGAKSRLTNWSLMLMILFFAWLTFYTATCDPFETVSIMMNGEMIETTRDCVKECGCFGNAIPLTPWESFYKDLILLFFITITFFNQKKISINTNKEDIGILVSSLVLISLFSFIMLDWAFPVIFTIITFVIALTIKKLMKKDAETTVWSMAAAVTILSVSFAMYTYLHLPIKDYRPYAVGKNIKEGMTLPPNAKPDVYENTWTYKVNGEEHEYTDAEKPWDIAGAEFVSRDSKLISKGDETPVKDFELTAADGTDMTQAVLEEPVIFLVVMYDLAKTNTKMQPKVNALAQAAYNDGYYTYGMSASLFTEIEDFRHEHQNMFDYLQADQITLKTIVRSNPGVLLLKQGTVIAKWHHNDLPTYEEIKTKYGI